MFWEWRSAKQGIEDERRGWQKFHRRSGLWPWWSMLATIVLTPVCFAVAIFGFLGVLNRASGRLILIYPGLVLSIAVPALVWFALRRIANHVDVRRAERHRNVPRSIQRFIE